MKYFKTISIVFSNIENNKKQYTHFTYGRVIHLKNKNKLCRLNLYYLHIYNLY